MHFGFGNPNFQYTMLDKHSNQTIVIQSTKSERDLGVILTNDGKWHEQANRCAAKANSILGWMKSSFMSRDETIWKQIFTTYIRPHLEFAVQAWNPYHKQDILTIEKVQQRATKVAHSLKKLSYPERLTHLGLTTLEERRIRGDCIQAYKFQTKQDIINWSTQPIVTDALYGHRPRLIRQYVPNCDQRHYFFTNRIVNFWNELPDSVTVSNSTNTFKNNYDMWKSTIK